MAGFDLLDRRRAASAADLAPLARAAARPLPPLADAEAFAAAFDRFGEARVVLLGEASHGTSEFYRARAAVTRRLVERHGFRILALEADWPEAARIDRHVRGLPARPDGEPFARFPTWMWRNREVADFVERLAGFNAGRPADDRVEVRGLDVYSMGSSIEAVLDYLDRHDPEAAVRARQRYGCLTPWQSDPAAYGHAVLSGRREPCEDEVVRQLGEILAKRVEDGRAAEEDWFDAAQNARIVRSAEQYYRLMYRGSTESWNLRDRHMYETLRAVMQARGPGSKAIVWAHNSHIGNAAATQMGWQGEFNIGELCRTAFADGAVLIGFGTDRGTVAAASDWGGPMEVKTVLPSRADSVERVFREAGVSSSLTLLDSSAPELVEALATPRLERAIGVIYRPETERASHYFDVVLPEQFDAWVWFEETSAVTPLPAGRPQGAPDTWPFGV